MPPRELALEERIELSRRYVAECWAKYDDESYSDREGALLGAMDWEVNLFELKKEKKRREDI